MSHSARFIVGAAFLCCYSSMGCTSYKVDICLDATSGEALEGFKVTTFKYIHRDWLFDWAHKTEADVRSTDGATIFDVKLEDRMRGKIERHGYCDVIFEIEGPILRYKVSPDLTRGFPQVPPSPTSHQIVLTATNHVLFVTTPAQNDGSR